VNVAKLVADHLLTVAAITAIAGTRIYWGLAPVTPEHKSLVRVTLINGGRLHNLAYAAPEVQVSAFARTKENVEALKEAIVDELRNRGGPMGSVFVVSVYQSDQTFPPDANGWWHAPVTIGLRYKES
jgi:hypothetical protein